MSVEISEYIDAKTLSKGLPQRADQRMWQPTAVELFNVKCTEYGLDAYQNIEQVYKDGLYADYGISVDVPFPALFLMKDGTVYLWNKQKLYEVNMSTLSTTNVDLTTVSLYDIVSTSTVKNPIAGYRWNLVDFDGAWLFVNGQSSVIKPNIDTSGKIFVENTVNINAGCYSMGRSIVGGFNSANFWNLEWRSYWEQWLAKNSYGLTLDLGLGSNFIMWSNAIGNDVFMLYYPSMMQNGLIESDYGSDDPFIMDILKSNDSGFMPMSWRGSVLDIKDMKGNLVVLGDGGVSYLRPVNSELGFTYGETVIAREGLANPGAVDGDDEMLLYVTKDGMAHMVSDGQIKDLDYRAFFQPMIAQGVYVYYNSAEKEFIICNNLEAYCLTKYGLSEVGQKVTNIIFYNNSLTVGRY